MTLNARRCYYTKRGASTLKNGFFSQHPWVWQFNERLENEPRNKNVVIKIAIWTRTLSFITHQMIKLLRAGSEDIFRSDNLDPFTILPFRNPWTSWHII